MSQAFAAVPTTRVVNPDVARRPAYEDVRHSRGVTTYKPPPEAVVRVPRSQSDQIGLMYDRRQIGEVLLKAGREFQRMHELAGHHLRSSGDLREWVDGGRLPRDGITDSQLKATKRIIEWQGLLGADGYKILCAVLLENCTLRFVADHDTHMMPGKRATDHMGYSFRRHLSALARAEGLT